MRGRDTPSPELRVAARFIRARLERLGFEPGAGDDWFHRYTIAERRLDPQRSDVTLYADGSELTLEFGKDYYVYSFRQTMDASSTRGSFTAAAAIVASSAPWTSPPWARAGFCARIAVGRPTA